MSLTLAVRFPAGRYHASPWDRTPNEGVTEWPPSPWRICRALVSTRYQRWPALDDRVFHSVLRLLTSPPSYRTPEVGAGHSRHYLPDASHRTSAREHTDLTLDPFLAVDPSAELLVRWDAIATPEERETLAKLAEQVPYLGRSESVCQMRLHLDELSVDESWWTPASVDDRSEHRILCLSDTLTREELEATPTELRRRGIPQPPGTRWVDYTGPESPLARGTAELEPPLVDAVRWSLITTAPFRESAGVLATDLLRTGVLSTLSHQEVEAPTRLVGRRDGEKLADQHAHAHWLWHSREELVLGLSVSLPPGSGLTTEVVASLLRRRSLHGPRDYTPDGFVPGSLHLVAAGNVEQCLPELVGPSESWVSRTPYLPTRHRKKLDPYDFIREDVSRELEHRSLPEIADLEVLEERADWARRHRRYRLREHMGHRRPGVAVHLRLVSPTNGPLSLGALSHFGFGSFHPVP